jgi:queuine tRNA-ribosyltransferase
VPAELYETIDIKKSQYARDWSVFSPENPAIEKPYAVGYVHHLMRTEMPNGFRLAVLNNMYFYVQLMQTLRDIIEKEGEMA